MYVTSFDFKYDIYFNHALTDILIQPNIEDRRVSLSDYRIRELGDADV